MSSSKKSASRKHEMDLPYDVLYNDIFILLPAKQVAQMRSLSKTWNALLTRSLFIKSHLHHSIHNNNHINETLFVFHDSCFSSNEPLTVRSSQSPHLQLTNFIKFPVNKPLAYRNNRVIGSLNGLICFLNFAREGELVNIWNPSLSALVTFPPYNIPIPDDYVIDFKFGYDPTTDDYKVVKLTYFISTHSDVIENCLPIEVYSVRNGSWVSISEKFPTRITWIYGHQDQLYVDGHDGHLHWLCYVDDATGLLQTITIVAFDLGVETFGEISLPNSIQNYNKERWTVLGVLSKKLCVISCISGQNCEVWVMDKYGVAESWIKHHILSQFSGDIVPIGFTLNNNFVFRIGRRLALYDPNAAVVRLFKITIKPHWSADIVHYVDSLVWVIPGR